MFASMGRAARLIFDPAFAGIAAKALLLTVLLFAVGLGLSEYALSRLPVLGNPAVNAFLELLAPFVFVFGGVVLGPPVAALFASLFSTRSRPASSGAIIPRRRPGPRHSQPLFGRA